MRSPRTGAYAGVSGRRSPPDDSAPPEVLSSCGRPSVRQRLCVDPVSTTTRPSNSFNGYGAFSGTPPSSRPRRRTNRHGSASLPSLVSQSDVRAPLRQRRQSQDAEGHRPVATASSASTSIVPTALFPPAVGDRLTQSPPGPVSPDHVADTQKKHLTTIRNSSDRGSNRRRERDDVAVGGSQVASARSGRRLRCGPPRPASSWASRHAHERDRRRLSTRSSNRGRGSAHNSPSSASAVGRSPLRYAS